MSTVREFHNQAMRIAQEAESSRESGNESEAVRQLDEALRLEVQAANLIERVRDSEPTRSILLRSAASLAYQSGDFAYSQRLIGDALAGYPPPTVEHELKDLLEQISFAEHLKVRGLELTGEQLQLSIVGPAVSNGLAEYRTVSRRIESLVKMLNRTARRLSSQRYMQRAGLESDLFVPMISVPRPGSFAVSVEVALREPTRPSMLVSGKDVVNDVISGVRLLDQKNAKVLQEVIPDKSYYVNFVSLAHELAPDGQAVTMVGLSSNTDEVSLHTISKDLPPPIPIEDLSPESQLTTQQLTIRGVLDVARGRGRESVDVTDEENRHITLRVHEGLDDIVRSHWKQQVEATYRRDDGRNELLYISSLE